MTDEAAARRAQKEVSALLKGRARVAGIAIVDHDGDLAVRVNLVDDGGVRIPERQCGVRILVRRVAPPRAR